MRVLIKKWGNSPSVRIPAEVMNMANLTLGTLVEVRADNGRIIIEPVYPRELDLDELIEGITADNLHAEVDFGEPARQ